MTAREALAAAFQLDPADVQAEDDTAASVEHGEYLYSIYQDQQTGEWVATRRALRFEGAASGRTPDEALAGLVAPSPIPTPEPVERGPWRVL